jgi:hypothetical protein
LLELTDPNRKENAKESFHFVEDIERRPGGWDNFANAKEEL